MIFQYLTPAISNLSYFKRYVIVEEYFCDHPGKIAADFLACGILYLFITKRTPLIANALA